MKARKSQYKVEVKRMANIKSLKLEVNSSSNVAEGMAPGKGLQ